METLEAPVETETAEFEFNLSHRCDRCGAEAKIRAVFEAGDLLFCGHHGTKYMPSLVNAKSIQGKHL